MITIIQKHSSPSIRAGNLEVKLASNLTELDAAMRLRFEVFNLELQEGLVSSYDRGYDTDAYDAYCDHLIVKDLTSGEVVGTYRLLRGSQAERNIGFYSENEFDLSNLMRLRGETLELGRSCVAATHRSFATLNLLWSAIVKYADDRDLRYLFGCASLHVSAASEVQPVYSHLRAKHFAPEKYRVYPVESCRMAINEAPVEGGDSRAALAKLSPILKGYLRAGAMICGAPAYDAEFGTADVLAILEMEKMAGRFKHRYVADTEAQVHR
ncbi:MAG TPA: GNAT family N-acyltransferase [Blastocatellia bacterium]|jgi:putative hemolysin|nr:GNAT family N-acyltransferase [Blastocatellia bacterium]